MYLLANILLHNVYVVPVYVDKSKLQAEKLSFLPFN